MDAEKVEVTQRMAAVMADIVDTQLAHMTGREMVDDGTIFPALALAALEASGVSELLSAIDRWAEDNTPETEQAILDARAALDQYRGGKA